MPKIDLSKIPESNATGYPAPFDQAVSGRWYRRLSPATGMTAFGASHVRLEPGAWSAQRHWHIGEDEFLVMVAGAATLIDEAGETPLVPGDCCAFPASDGNGHHIVNRSDAPCIFVVVGAGPARGGDYPDIDMRFTPDDGYVHKDGTPYDAQRVR